MKNQISIVLLMSSLLFVLLLTSCEKELFRNCSDGEGPVVSHNVEIDAIKGINVLISADVEVQQGETQSIVIEAQQNIIDGILDDSSVNSGIWKICIDGCVNTSEAIKITIILPEYESLVIGGGGNIKSSNTLAVSDDLELNIIGSGDIEIDMEECETTELFISGSGNIILNGAVTNDVDINIIGSGDVFCNTETTDNVEGFIGGSGNIDYTGTSTKEVEFNIIGSGDILFDAPSNNLTLGISGSGKIDALQGTSNNLNISLLGSGNVTAVADSSELVHLEIPGSGSITMAGITQKEEINIIGGGDINAFDLISTNCEINVGGSGKIEVNVIEQLDIKMNVSGDICYKGNPAINISGGNNGGSIQSCN